jgi:putative phosphoribosyl transferase
MSFIDRGDAGRRLARHLLKYREEKGVVVLGLPRGGVVVAAEVAEALGAGFDVMIVRKLGSPRNPELAIGAIAETGARVMNGDIIESLRVPPGYIEEETARQEREIVRRKMLYREGREIVPLTGKTVIVVDDGIATGATFRAALEGVRAEAPSRLVAAVPVAAPDSAEEIAATVDDFVCPLIPTWFMAVGAFFSEFDQVEDDEVVRILRAFESSGRDRSL